MNTNKFAIKFKRYAVLGISLLGLAAMGCGGGSGTLVSNATLQVGNGNNLNGSLGTVGKTSKALAALPAGTLNIYSIDGDLLDTQAVTSFASNPVITLNGTKKAAAQASGVLVACLGDGTTEYRTIFKLSAADLATNGPVLDENGATRTEDADGTSTVLASLLESELSNAIGAPVKTCQELSDGAKLALNAAVSTDATATRIAIDDIAADTKAAASVAGSLVSSLVSLAGSLTVTDVDNFVRTGRKADGTTVVGASDTVNQAKSLAKAAVKLSRASKDAAAATFSKNVLQATPATAVKAAASADAIGAALQIAASDNASADVKTAMNNAVTAALAGDVTAGAAGVAEAALDVVVNGQATELNSGSDLDAVATLIGAGLAGADQGSAAAKKAEAALQVTLSTAADKEKLLGKTLEAGASNGAAITKIVNSGLNSGVDVAKAVKKAGAGSKSEIAQAVADNSSVTIADSVAILGPKSAKASSTKKLLYTLDKLETQAGTYTYVWSAVAGATTTTVGDALLVTPTTEGNLTLTVTQNLGGVAVSTDQLTVVIAAEQPPVILADSDELAVRQGSAAPLTLIALAADGSALTPTVTIGSGSGCATAVSGLSAVYAGSQLTVSATTAVAAGNYCAKAVATSGNTSVNEVIAVEVVGVLPTTVVVDKSISATVGGTVTLNATAFHDIAVTGNLVLTVTEQNTSTVVGTTTVAVVEGQASTTASTSVTNIAAGIYLVEAALGAVTDDYAFTVSPAGAPTISSVKINGISVLTGDSVNFTTSGVNKAVTVVVEATDTDTSLTYSLVSEAATLDTSDAGTALTTTLNEGSNILGVSVSNSSNLTANVVFEVNINRTRDIEVTHVALVGTIIGQTTIDASSTPSASQTTLATSVGNGTAVIDAANVTGLDLDNVSGDELSFHIYTETPNANDVNGSHFDIEVELNQAGAVNRAASLSIDNATLTASSGGWDVTTAASFAFAGTRENGTRAQVQVASIATLDSLFLPVTDGIKLDLLGLRDAMKTILDAAGHTGFSSSLMSISGTGISVEVTISSSNFSFVLGGESFNTFKITNISVD